LKKSLAKKLPIGYFLNLLNAKKNQLNGEIALLLAGLGAYGAKKLFKKEEN